MIKKGRFTALAAALFLVASPAVAQDGTGGNNTGALGGTPPGPGEPFTEGSENMMTEGVFDFFFEDDGETVRSEDDFMAAFEAGSPEDQELARTACTEWEEARVGFLDSVSSLCRSIVGPTDEQ
jgi:hypothetical protein